MEVSGSIQINTVREAQKFSDPDVEHCKAGSPVYRSGFHVDVDRDILPVHLVLSLLLIRLGLFTLKRIRILPFVLVLRSKIFT
jgi:hypothetical protein